MNQNNNIIPKIYLAVDNCFASKRWTNPADWMRLLADLDVYHVEASADNESDPLYTTDLYRKKWLDEIDKESVRTGVKVSNFYSGHGTYTTTGLAHEDESVREHIMNNWLKKMIDVAKTREAGLGFFCHAFNRKILLDKEKYHVHLEDLYNRLAHLAVYAGEKKIRTIGVEQMYTPHQIPWTIEGAKELIRHVYNRSGYPFYITIDVGHQSGQQNYMKPEEEKVKTLINLCKKGENTENMWLGHDKAYEIFEEAVNSKKNENGAYIKKILELSDEFPHLFAESDDGDTYKWLKSIGCYSPIIHLQQTNGLVSAHWPFNEQYNEQGIITGEKVLRSLIESYKQKNQDEMPPMCEEIYLTIEIFAGTSEIPYDTLKKLKASVEYWRKYIPKDGMRLDELL